MTNTPLQYVADDLRINAPIVQVDLFSGMGELPKNLDQVQERAKDIQYSSKTRFNTKRIEELDPNLTLEGLRILYERNTKAHLK